MQRGPLMPILVISAIISIKAILAIKAIKAITAITDIKAKKKLSYIFQPFTNSLYHSLTLKVPFIEVLQIFEHNYSIAFALDVFCEIL